MSGSTDVVVPDTRVPISPAAREPVPPKGADGYRAETGWEKQYARLLIGLDVLALGIAAALAYLVRFGGDKKVSYLVMTVVLPLLWVGTMSLGRAYEARFVGQGPEEFRRVINGAVRLLAGLSVLSYATKAELARTYVLSAILIATLLTLVGRFAARVGLRRARARGRHLNRVLIVGAPSAAAQLHEAVARHQDGWQVVGVCTGRATDVGARTADPAGRACCGVPPPPHTVAGTPVVGTFDDVVAAVRGVRATTVAVAGAELDGATLRRVMWTLEGTDVDVFVASALTEVSGPRLSIRAVGGLPLLHVEEPELRGARRLVKTLFDRLVALAALLLLSPVLLVLALAVKLGSSGPVIFRQERIGRAGRPFTMWKFRSMYTDAEARLAGIEGLNETDGLLFKMRADPRVTRTGRVLRKWSLDELPQLVNILTGSMSLVGPRPPLEREVARYGDDVRRRLMVKPGLTGLWQVSGRSDLAWDESVRLDLGYVENWSLTMDLIILARTAAAVLGRIGAY